MDTEITGSTRVFGVIGHPVGHTLSPLMINAAFKERGLDCIYLPFHVEKKLLHKAIEGMRGLNIAGLNVTIPHKVEVMKLLDDIDESARAAGAVNTIVNNNGILRGLNTDGEGFLYALNRAGIGVSEKRIVVLGAGGASRAVISVLAANNALITILNRTLEKARDLARAGAERVTIEAMVLNPDNLALAISKADILVNTTSVGMTPGDNVSPVPAALLKRTLTVVDIVYNPIKTKLIDDAGKAGCTIVEGVHMLVGQGALAFEQWTGKNAPVEMMTAIALENLQKK